MKKANLLLAALGILILVIVFWRCNNATQEPETDEVKKPDTVIVKPDSTRIDSTIKTRKAGQ